MSRTAIWVSIGLISMMTISALPADAVNVPTPGWVSVANGMSQTAEGRCEGTIEVHYALKAIDSAGGVRTRLNPDCSVKVLRRNSVAQVTIGTTGPVMITADAYYQVVRARFIESFGNECTRIQGEQAGDGGGFTPASPTPTAYGSGCSAGWKQTWSGYETFNGRTYFFTQTLKAGLNGFGVAHCSMFITASDGSSDTYAPDCLWDDGSTVTYSTGDVLDERIEIGQFSVKKL